MKTARVNPALRSQQDNQLKEEVISYGVEF